MGRMFEMRSIKGLSDKIQFVCLLIALVLVIILLAKRKGTAEYEARMDERDLFMTFKLQTISRVGHKAAEVVIQVDLSENSTSLQDMTQRIGNVLGNRLKIRNVVDNIAIFDKLNNKDVHLDLFLKKATKIVAKTKTVYPSTLYSDYIINNKDICTNLNKSQLLLLVVVHTAISHFQRRRWLRETWVNKNAYKNIAVRVIFLFGEPHTTDEQSLIDNENLVYGDVIQGRFRDSYKNLTLKGVLGLRWITEHCQHANLIIKVDDDVYVNMFDVIEKVLPVYGKKPRQLICHVRPHGTSPIERGKHKWSVEQQQFKEDKFYPTYCNGYAVFMTPDVIAPMFRAALYTPFFWIDDVYLFGLLPKKLGGFTWVDFAKYFTLIDKIGLESFISATPRKFIVSSVVSRDAIENMWFYTLRKLSVAARKFVEPTLLQSVDAVFKEEMKVTVMINKAISNNATNFTKLNAS